MTDKLLQNSGLSFHIGTDDPTVEELLHGFTNHHEFCESLIPMLWKGKEEDIKLIGLLGIILKVMLGVNYWCNRFADSCLTLEVMEEIKI